jgi:hypothetical protein
LPRERVGADQLNLGVECEFVVGAVWLTVGDASGAGGQGKSTKVTANSHPSSVTVTMKLTFARLTSTSSSPARM